MPAAQTSRRQVIRGQAVCLLLEARGHSTGRAPDRPNASSEMQSAPPTPRSSCSQSAVVPRFWGGGTVNSVRQTEHRNARSGGQHQERVRGWVRQGACCLCTRKIARHHSRRQHGKKEGPRGAHTVCGVAPLHVLLPAPQALHMHMLLGAWRGRAAGQAAALGAPAAVAGFFSGLVLQRCCQSCQLPCWTHRVHLPAHLHGEMRLLVSSCTWPGGEW